MYYGTPLFCSVAKRQVKLDLERLTVAEFKERPFFKGAPASRTGINSME